MIQQQQVYPHFGGQTIPSNNATVGKRDGTPGSVSPPPNGVAVCVIKETESVRNLSINRHEHRRSVSPSDKSTASNSSIIKRSDSLIPLSPTSVVTKLRAISAAAAAAKLPSSDQLHKFDVQRFIKRSNSIDDDDELYDAEAEDRIIKQAERRERQYDSEPDAREDEHLYDYSGRYTTDDDDGPLDLSLPSERRRQRTYSDTESDDSAGTNEDKAGGKAAYKKNLMKRYRK